MIRVQVGPSNSRSLSYVAAAPEPGKWTPSPPAAGRASMPLRRLSIEEAKSALQARACGSAIRTNSPAPRSSASWPLLVPAPGKSSGEGLDDQGEQKALVTRGITPEGPQGASSRGVQQTGRIGRRPPTLVNQPPLRSPVALVRGHRHAPEGSHTGGHVDHQGGLPGRARDSGGNRVRAQKGSGRSEGSHTGAAAPGVRHEQGDEPVPEPGPRHSRQAGPRHCRYAPRRTRCPRSALWPSPVLRRTPPKQGRGSRGRPRAPPPAVSRTTTGATAGRIAPERMSSTKIGIRINPWDGYPARLARIRVSASIAHSSPVHPRAPKTSGSANGRSFRRRSLRRARPSLSGPDDTGPRPERTLLLRTFESDPNAGSRWSPERLFTQSSELYLTQIESLSPNPFLRCRPAADCSPSGPPLSQPAISERSGPGEPDRLAPQKAPGRITGLQLAPARDGAAS